METTVHLLLPLTSYRPEEMRVASIGEWFAVQSYSPSIKKWVLQKEHLKFATAIADAIDWYSLDNSWNGGIERIHAIYKQNDAVLQIQ